MEHIPFWHGLGEQKLSLIGGTVVGGGDIVVVTVASQVGPILKILY